MRVLPDGIRVDTVTAGPPCSREETTMTIVSDTGEMLASAVIVPCTSRKCVLPSEQAIAVSLPLGSQDEVETAWYRQISELPLACRADTLYAGRGFNLAKRAAASARAPLYVASAGLGLVAADETIPTYGLTVAAGTPDSVGGRVDGEFDVVRWWRAISQSPFSAAIDDLPGGPLAVVAALSRPYARMMAAEFEGVRDPGRWRFIGVGLESILPPSVRRSVLPYDQRLEGLRPGTRADFPQRALVHFVEEILRHDPSGDLEAHAAAVDAALSEATAPVRARRPRKDDAEIREAIRRRLGSETGTGIGRLLRSLRVEDGIACEQARFGRLYREVLGSEAG